MKKLKVYDWVPIITGGLVFCAYLYFVVFSFQHYESGEAFMLTEQTDRVWMDTLEKESRLIL